MLKSNKRFTHRIESSVLVNQQSETQQSSPSLLSSIVCLQRNSRSNVATLNPGKEHGVRIQLDNVVNLKLGPLTGALFRKALAVSTTC